jgi:hypothetical protein
MTSQHESTDTSPSMVRGIADVSGVVFDLGGVLIDWNPDYLYRQLIPDSYERERFLSTICTPEWNHEMDAGRSVPSIGNMLQGQQQG